MLTSPYGGLMLFEMESIANLKDVKLLNVQSYYAYLFNP